MSLAPPPTKPSLPQIPNQKVVLAKGFGQLDWAHLSEDSSVNLRGVDSYRLLRISPSQLSSFRTEDQLWVSYHGKVYNLTRYLPFHPGGPEELFKVAGQDAEKEFMKAHAWVNWDALLKNCCVGVLVRDGEEDDLDEFLGM